MSHNRWGVYTHVPWCRRRCPYCAFYVEVDRGPDWEAFTDAVAREYDLRRTDFESAPSTVYFGGGTPSRMPLTALTRLLRHIHPQVGAEISFEANPEDITPHWLDALLETGVNRISLGIQTFDERFARVLNRVSTESEARATARTVARSGLRSWSADVIFALPNQSLHDLRVDLEAILAVEPPHVSLYGLTYEPGTPFERARNRGRFRETPDTEWREMYDLLVENLRAAGYERYEVSNFALPGHRCHHNSGYWQDRPYMGLGPSAHGYHPDGSRWTNVRDVNRYLEVSQPTERYESFEPGAAAIDLLISGLRGVEGISRHHMRTRCLREVGPSTLTSLIRGGLIHDDPDRIRLTDEGFPLADGVVCRLVDSLRSPVELAG